MKPPSCSTACKKKKGIRNNNAEGFPLPCHATVMTIISFSFFEELKSNVTSFVIVISVTKPRENRGNQSSLPYHRATRKSQPTQVAMRPQSKTAARPRFISQFEIVRTVSCERGTSDRLREYAEGSARTPSHLHLKTFSMHIRSNI